MLFRDVTPDTLTMVLTVSLTVKRNTVYTRPTCEARIFSALSWDGSGFYAQKCSKFLFFLDP